MELNHYLFSYNSIDSSVLLQLTRTVLTRELLNIMAVNLDPHMYHSDLFSFILYMFGVHSCNFYQSCQFGFFKFRFKNLDF